MRSMLAVALVGVATLLTYLCRGVVGDASPFSFFFPAVLVAAFVGGVVPGLIATGLSVLVIDPVLRQPDDFSFVDRADAVRFAIFAFVGVLGSLLCGALHRSWRAAEAGMAAARESEQRLAESQRQLVGIFRQATVGIAETFLDGRFRLANPSFCEMLGYSVEELQRLSIVDVIHPDDRQTMQAHTRQLIDGETDRYTVQKRYVRKDGTAVWAEVTRSVVRDDRGQAQYTLSIVHDLTPQKRMEVAAKFSESRFRTLFETAPVGISISREGRTLYANRAYLQMFGYDSEAELRGRHISELIAPAHREALIARNVRREQGADEARDYETVGLRKDGSTFPFHIVVSRIETEDGPASVGFFTDVSRQRLAERTARDNEERLELALAAAEMGTWRWELDSDLDTRGPSLNRILGLEPVTTTLPAEDFFDRVHPDDRMLVAGRVESSIASGEAYEAEFRIVRSDGTIRWVRDRGKLITDGSRRSMTGALVDVTELREAQQALQTRERELQAIVENVPSIIARYDTDLRCLFINPAVEVASGRPASAFAGRTVAEMPMPPAVNEQMAAAMGEVIRTGEARTVEFSYAAPDRERWYQTRVIPELGPDGRPAYVLTLSHDITDIKAAEAELERVVRQEQAARQQVEAASAAKDQFLAVLSHELRTPLTPVVMTVAAMEMDPSLPMDVREDLAMIRRNVELETKLIDDLLDVTRIVNGKLRLQPTRTALHPLVHHVLSILGSDIERKRLRVELDLSAADDVVNGDPARLQQVLWNLIKNAVKFSFDGGLVEIRTSNAPEHSFRIEVIDQGVGIEPDAMGRLFDAFEQGSASVTRQFGGLGLGLAISKAIIDLHGGTITAASDGRNQGARFNVRVPTMAAVERLVDKIQPPDVPNKADGLRVLLVEDHVDTAKMLSRYLAGVGYHVATAGSVAAALTLASERQFDVIVSDIGLPDATGLDLIRQIRQRSDVPGIAISGFGMETDIRSSQHAGFNCHLTKPIDPRRLHATIHQVVVSGAANATR